LLADLNAERKRRTEGPIVEVNTNWEPVNIDENLYRVVEHGDVQASAILNYPRDASLSDIFMSFVNEELISAIWNNSPLQRWTYVSGSSKSVINRGNLSLKLIYRYYAIAIRIIGEQDSPKEGDRVKNPLRNSLKAMALYFKELHPNNPPPGKDILETLAARFLISTEHFALLSRNIQANVRDMGQILAGDEKLLKFTGRNEDVRMIITKPDKIGLWFYQLTVSLRNEATFLVHMKLWRTEKKTRETSPVHIAVVDWADVVRRHGEIAPNPNSILIMDSYYMIKASGQVCKDKGIMFLGSAKSNNFNNLTKDLQIECRDKGSWAGRYNVDTQDLFVHKYEKNEDLGRKFCYTNAFRKPLAPESSMELFRDMTYIK